MYWDIKLFIYILDFFCCIPKIQYTLHILRFTHANFEKSSPYPVKKIWTDQCMPWVVLICRKPVLYYLVVSTHVIVPVKFPPQPVKNFGLVDTCIPWRRPECILLL